MREAIRFRTLGAALLAVWLASAGAHAGGGESVVLVGAGSLWRRYYVFFPPRLSEAAARELMIDPKDLAARRQALKWRLVRYTAAGPICSGLETPRPPSGWREVDFDDAAWLGGPGPDLIGGEAYRLSDPAYARGTDAFVPEVGCIARRARFVLRDRTQVRKLRLSITCRGGFVAYLNGREVARGAMPPGRVDVGTASTHAYPLEAFLAKAKDGSLGGPLHRYTHRHESFHRQWALREKGHGPVEVDSRLLRNGVNVLAVELHRSDYPAICAGKKVGLCFATLGLSRLALRAETPPGNVVGSRERPEGLQVWTVPAWQGVSDTSFADPAEPLRPLRIAAARNGTFGGQVVVGSREAIRGLRVRASGLAGPGRIGPEHVRVRFALRNPARPGQYCSRANGIGGTRFDMLVDHPPERVEPLAPEVFRAGHDTRRCVVAYRRELDLPGEPVLGATQPAWVSVRVPADARAGTYRGSVTVSVRGAEAVDVPVELTVADWALPDVKDFASHLFIYQSPDSLAEHYRVPLWSEAHWRLIDRSMALMGRAGNIGLNLPLLAKTQPGNSQSLVVWVRRPDGSYAHDFARFDRYLAAALKHHDAARLKVVQLYVWGRELGCPRDRRTAEGPEYREKAYRGARVTRLDTDTGEYDDLRLPDYERPEAERLLRPLLRGVRERLKARGLERAMVIGISSDPGTIPEHAAALRRILPGVPWFRDSHFGVAGIPYDRADGRKQVPVGCNTVVWSGWVPDPKRQRCYGWQVKGGRLVLSFNRAGVGSLNLHGFCPPWDYHIWMECTLALGRNGAGRVGGDYFARSHRDWVDNRYRGAQIGGALKIYNGVPDLFAPHPDGPVATVRMASALLGIQQAEARVFVEKALLGGALPEDLARRCQALLDQRTNAIRMNPLGRSLGRQGWARSTRRLFQCAAEVAKACERAE